MERRREDPDTWFFGRRLVMEGDTELALLVKHTLDALDFPILDLNRRPPRNPSNGWGPAATRRDVVR